MKDYPAFRLDHLRALTDSTGLIQHAIYSIPNRKTGYSIDDNARALMVVLEHIDRTEDSQALHLASTYLSFLHYAQTPSFRFHNFMAYDQTFLDKEGSEDSFGRTLLACGFALGSRVHENIKRVARELLDNSIRWVPTLASARSRAYAIQALYYAHRAEPERDRLPLLMQVADSLAEMFERNAHSEWVWFEPFLTYCNGLLPHTLFLAYELTEKPSYLQVAKRSLDFLIQNVMVGGVLQPIGSDGWYIRGQERAWFDQQPVDAASMVSACVAAAEISGEKSYSEVATAAFDWFFGANVLREPLYDPVTGGCFDGLQPDRLNLNQGAESTLSYLMAHLAILRGHGQRRMPAP